MVWEMQFCFGVFRGLFGPFAAKPPPFSPPFRKSRGGGGLVVTDAARFGAQGAYSEFYGALKGRGGGVWW